MEVATAWLPTPKGSEFSFQHLFFLMEVATGLQVFSVEVPLKLVSTPFLPNGSRYPSILQPRYSNQSRRRLRGSEKSSPQTPISPTSKPPQPLPRAAARLPTAESTLQPFSLSLAKLNYKFF